ncbi:MAG TPA: glutamyl-tRNA reductase [Ktedonobacterales bacterium]|jgi:glutamyl-tRNA reductase
MIPNINPDMSPNQSHLDGDGRARSAALLLLVGLDHHSAPVELRERLSVEGEELTALLRSLHEEPLAEAVVVSTCHRLEVYAISADTERAQMAIVERLAAPLVVAPDTLMESLYAMTGTGAARHLARVAAGLESVVIGESQIQGQVADALLAAHTARTAGPHLARLFSTALHAGKRARSETAVGRHSLSVGHAAAQLVARDLGDLTGKRVTVVGAGEMAALAIQALRARGARDLSVVSRTYERAHALAGRYQAVASPWSERSQALMGAQAVVVATRAPHLLLRAEDFAQEASDERPVVVDISVPRAVDPAVRGLTGLRLYDIDDLQAIVAERQQLRHEEIALVEEIVEEELAGYLAWERTRRVAPAITALRQQAREVAQAEVERALRRAPELDEREQEILREMAHRIVNKLLHTPTVNLKERAARGEHRFYLHATRKLFALEEHDADSANGSDDE